MATLREIHDALATQLETIDGLRCYAYPPQGSNPPVGFVTLDTTNPLAMGRQGWLEHRFDVYVFTAQSTRPQDGYRTLIEYADHSGAKSVPLAVWDGNDRSAGTFAGLSNTSAHFESFAVLGADDVDAFEMYGGLFTVLVKTLGA